MRILFISNELIAGDIAYRMAKDGHEIRLHIKEKDRKECFDGMVQKTQDWRADLPWVGKDGLIIFDDVGHGKEQDLLRKEGYVVVGGSRGGERLETERSYAQKVFKEVGLPSLETHDFSSFEEVFSFVEKKGRPWVIKCSGHMFKHYSFIGRSRDGSDVLQALRTYANLSKKTKHPKITLQERVFGVEIGVGRYFNGSNWVGPIEYNIEHPRLFAGDIGPIINEMGTVAWYGDNEQERMFRTLLEPLTGYLREVNFRGDFSINTITNNDAMFPIEATTRFGTPIIHIQTALHEAPWADFLFAIGKGLPYTLPYKKGFGVGIFGGLPPFPYPSKTIGTMNKGTPIIFSEHITEEEKDHVHFEEVAKSQSNNEQFHIASVHGYCLYTTGVAGSVKRAKAKALSIMQKIHVHKMFYRSDIGDQFAEKDRTSLRASGVLVPLDVQE